jgi:hypothetical protein
MKAEMKEQHTQGGKVHNEKHWSTLNTKKGSKWSLFFCAKFFTLKKRKAFLGFIELEGLRNTYTLNLNQIDVALHKNGFV